MSGGRYGTTATVLGYPVSPFIVFLGGEDVGNHEVEPLLDALGLDWSLLPPAAQRNRRRWLVARLRVGRKQLDELCLPADVYADDYATVLDALKALREVAA